MDDYKTDFHQKSRRVPVEKNCKSTVYITPPRVLEPVRAYFGGEIDLDPATEQDNPTGANTYFTGSLPVVDGLLQPWNLPAYPFTRVFVNPPYGKTLKLWLEKIREEARRGCEIVALLPVSRTEQLYMMDTLAGPESSALCFVRKRVNFLRPGLKERANGNPYASVLVGYSVDWNRFKEAFGGLGYCIKVEEVYTTIEE